MKNTGSEIFTELKKLWENKSLNILVVAHENPDGDAMGSAIGLANVLQNIGHVASVVSPNDYPSFLKWFSSPICILLYDRDKKKVKKLLEKTDLIVCVDFNEFKRVGIFQKRLLSFEGKKILIDHHPNPSYFCDITISEPHYSSTSELVFDILKRTGFSEYIDGESAEALYTGILTDTGSFSHNISNPNTFEVVAGLMQYGINTGKIQSNVYHNFSADRMKFLGYCLNEKMMVFPEYRSAVISISKEEQDLFNFETGDTEGFVNYPLSIKNIVFSAFFIEKEGLVKASFRSKGSFPANRFSSEHYNGGGHLNAAGGESYLSLPETLSNFAQLLEQYKHLLIETEI